MVHEETLTFIVLFSAELRVSSPTDTYASTAADTSTSRLPRLIDHLPLAEGSALDTFEILENNLLHHKSLGCSHQSLDTMICDCQYDPCKHFWIARHFRAWALKSPWAGSDDGQIACGIASQCINRLTQVECLANECPTRNACQNQRWVISLDLHSTRL